MDIFVNDIIAEICDLPSFHLHKKRTIENSDFFVRNCNYVGHYKTTR